jgi:hypothetical protein
MGWLELPSKNHFSVTLEVVTGEQIMSRISAETEEFQVQYSSSPSRGLLTGRMPNARALHRSFSIQDGILKPLSRIEHICSWQAENQWPNRAVASSGSAWTLAQSFVGIIVQEALVGIPPWRTRLMAPRLRLEVQQFSWMVKAAVLVTTYWSAAYYPTFANPWSYNIIACLNVIEAVEEVFWHPCWSKNVLNVM